MALSTAFLKYMLFRRMSSRGCSRMEQTLHLLKIFQDRPRFGQIFAGTELIKRASEG